MAKFIVYQDKAYEFRWQLQASNGRVIADSGEGYVSKAGARQAAERVRTDVAGATILEQ